MPVVASSLVYFSNFTTKAILGKFWHHSKARFIPNENIQNIFLHSFKMLRSFKVERPKPHAGLTAMAKQDDHAMTWYDHGKIMARSRHGHHKIYIIMAWPSWSLS